MVVPGTVVPEERKDLAALWRMAELCLPALEQCGAVTFLPRGGETLEEDWGDWLAEIYGPLLAPAVSSLQLIAASASFTALLGADASLGAALPESAASRSLAAGRRALLDFRSPQGVKLLERLRQAAADNASAGHLATVFAVRAHAFHLPAVQTAASLLLAECVLGAASVGVTISARRAAELLGAAARCSSAAPRLAAV